MSRCRLYTLCVSARLGALCSLCVSRAKRDRVSAPRLPLHLEGERGIASPNVPKPHRLVAEMIQIVHRSTQSPLTGCRRASENPRNPLKKNDKPRLAVSAAEQRVARRDVLN